MVTLRGKPFLTTWTRSSNELKIYELNSSNVFVQSGAAISIPSTSTPVDDSYRTWEFLFTDFSDTFLMFGMTTGTTSGNGQARIIKRNGSIVNTINSIWGSRGVTLGRKKIFSQTFKDVSNIYPAQSSADYTRQFTETAFNARSINTTNVGVSVYDDTALGSLAPDDSKLFIFNPLLTSINAARFNQYYQENQLLLTAVQTTSNRVNPFRNASYPNGVTYNDTEWAGNNYCICVGQINQQDVGFGIVVFNFKDSNQVTELTGRAEDVYSFTETLGQAKRVAVHPNSKLVAIGFKTLAGVYRTAIYRRLGKYLQRTMVIENFGMELSFTKDGRFLIDAGLAKAQNYVGNYQFIENTTMMANVTPATYQGISLHSDTQVEALPYNFLSAFANRDIDFDNLKALFLTSAATFDATDLTANEVTNNGAYVVTDDNIPVGGVPLTVTKTAQFGTVKVNVPDLQITPKNTIEVAKILIYDGTTERPLHLIDLTRNVVVDKGIPLQISFDQGLQWYTAQ